MGDKLKSIKEKTTTPKFNDLQLILAIISVVVFVFMNTSLFDEQSEIIKVTVYVTVMLLGTMLGGKLFGIGKKVLDIINILKDSTKTPAEKIQIITPIAIQILTALGLQYDLLNIEQHTKPLDIIHNDLSHNENGS